MTRSTRRLIVRTLAPFLLAGVAAWFLWPRREVPITLGPPRATGRAMPSGPVTPQVVVGWSFGALLDPMGELWLWGFVPVALPTPRPDPQIPTRAAPGTNWTQVAISGQHVVLRRDDGTLWGLGSNFNGQLGLPTAGWFGLTQIGTGTNWVEVAAMEGFTWARQSDGRLYFLGGALPLGAGTGTTSAAPATVPTVVPGADRWRHITAGITTVLALREDGALYRVTMAGPRPVLTPLSDAAKVRWQWVGQVGSGPFVGLDSEGRLLTTPPSVTPALGSPRTAAGTNGFYFVPGAEDAQWRRAVPTGTGVLAERADGTWWGLDVNQCGQLGLGDRSRRLALTQLSWPTEVLAMGGSYNTVAAWLTDGSLWCAGMRLGVVWERPESSITPGHKVHAVLNVVGSALDMPGARANHIPASLVPEAVWTWPGSAGPSNREHGRSDPGL